MRFIDRIWSFFSSITLAVIAFSVISVTSIIGTLIEQQAQPERNIKILAKMVGDSSAPAVYKILNALGFTDMFHSWWFIALLFMFAANLIICSIERFPNKWRLVREPLRPLLQEQFGSMPIMREIAVKAELRKVAEQTVAAARKMGIRLESHHDADAVQLFGEKGRYCRLGVYVTHLSILLILFGAVIGIFFGFNGHLNLPEGMSSSVAYSGEGRDIPLGFEIRCDDFEVSFYDKSDTPKAYKSRLTVIDNGKEMLTKEIEVNEPLRYKGITFYQSSYGFSPNKSARFIFTVTSLQGDKQDVRIGFGDTFVIPGTNVKAAITDFSPALGIDDKGRLFTYADTMNNPAVFLEFSEGGKLMYQQWILRRYPETWEVKDGIVEFRDLWGAQYTGLQVRKDPGVWIVYAGCFIMAIGLYSAFFMSHRRVWMILRREKEGTKVIIAALSSKNRIAFEEKIDRLLREIEIKKQQMTKG